MDPETKKILNNQTKKIDAIYASVEKTRKYFLWTLVITLVVIILPLIGMVFVLPTFISVITGGLI